MLFMSFPFGSGTTSGSRDRELRDIDRAVGLIQRSVKCSATSGRLLSMPLADIRSGSAYGRREPAFDRRAQQKVLGE